jgi:hypothetical protein
VIRLFPLALLMATVPAAGYTMAPDQASADQPAPEKKICKNQVVTGSIMSRRVCHTKAEWNALEAQAKADLDRTRDMERSRSMVGGNR